MLIYAYIISIHLDHSMRQIERNCDPDWFRIVPGPKNWKIQNPALNQVGIGQGLTRVNLSYRL